MGGNAGGFDPMAMAMMYQNMMKGSAGGERRLSTGKELQADDRYVTGNMSMGGGFDPNAMAMMYQNMMKSEPGSAIVLPVTGC